RNPEADQLVKGVVAGGRDGGVERRVVAAHRIGGLQMHDPLGAVEGPRDCRRRGGDLHPLPAGERAQAARLGAADLGSLAELDQRQSFPAPGLPCEAMYSTGNPSSRTTEAASERVKKRGSICGARRRAIAIERVKWPRPVPLEVTKRIRPPPVVGPESGVLGS